MVCDEAVLSLSDTRLGVIHFSPFFSFQCVHLTQDTHLQSQRNTEKTNSPFLEAQILSYTSAIVYFPEME